MPYLLPQPRSGDELRFEGEKLFDPKYDEQLSETGGDYDLNRSRLLEDLGLSRSGLETGQSRFLQDIRSSDQGLMRGRDRGLEDISLALSKLGTSRSRGLQDYGTQEGLLNRQKEQIARASELEGGALKERLATQGLGFGGGLGDIQREDLMNQQKQRQLSLQDAFSNLGTGRSRFLEDIGTSESGIGTNRSRLLEDFTTNRDQLGRQRTRGLEDYGLSFENIGRQKNRGMFDLDTEKSRVLRGIGRNRAADIEGYATNPLYQFSNYSY